MDRREQRFWSDVGEPNEDGCMEWMGTRLPRGYGSVTYKGERTTAHRIAYRLRKGEIPPGKFVLHKCDNPACCNPEHLFVGTQKDNIDDMIAKGRGYKLPPRRGEQHGMCKLTDDQVKEIRTLYSTTRISQDALAARFNIGQSQVSRIIKGQSRSNRAERSPQ